MRALLDLAHPLRAELVKGIHIGKVAAVVVGEEKQESRIRRGEKSKACEDDKFKNSMQPNASLTFGGNSRTNNASLFVLPILCIDQRRSFLYTEKRNFLGKMIQSKEEESIYVLSQCTM